MLIHYILRYLHYFFPTICKMYKNKIIVEVWLYLCIKGEEQNNFIYIIMYLITLIRFSHLKVFERQPQHENQ